MQSVVHSSIDSPRWWPPVAGSALKIVILVTAPRGRLPIPASTALENVDVVVGLLGKRCADACTPLARLRSITCMLRHKQAELDDAEEQHEDERGDEPGLDGRGPALGGVLTSHGALVDHSGWLRDP